MSFIRYFLHLKRQGIIYVSAAMAWNYLQFSAVFYRNNVIYRMLYTDIYWNCLFHDTVHFLYTLYTLSILTVIFQVNLG